MYKLVIGLPTYGNIPYQFASSLMSLQLPGDTRVIWKVRSMIDTSRNSICKMFLEESGEYLLMIDDDHIFDPDLVLKLMSHDVDIVGALAFKRRPDYQSCVYKKKKEDGLHYPILPENFQEVDVVGSGAILIKREVLEKLDFPYFWTNYDNEGTHWSVDFNFCKKAKKAGFKIFVDPSVEIKHIGDPEIVDKSTFIKHHNIIKK